MSQYSETIGSFERAANFPLEANYIFETEEQLQQWAIDNQVILHNGLLKVVIADNQQTLYWAVKKETNDELEFKKLISFNSIDYLKDHLQALRNKLNKEISDRQTGEDALWGDKVGIPATLNSIEKLADAITKMQEDMEKQQAANDKTHEQLKNELKAVVGTDDSDIIEYLQSLDFQSLTDISEKLNEFFNVVDPENPNIESLPAISDFLEGFTTSDTLEKILEKLVADLMGDPIPTEDFRTLRKIEDFVRKFKTDTENRERNLNNEINQVEESIGLNADGGYSPDKETYYLQTATSVMNALKTLDAMIHKALVGITITPHNDDVVDLNVESLENGYNIAAKLKLSDQSGNQLKKNSDGLFYNLEAEYVGGTLTLKVNGNIISQNNLGLSAIVNNAKYDPTTESVIIEFGLLNGQFQTITIPVGGLIREWEIDNNNPSKVVELSRTESIAGSDKLSGDVRLSTNKYNILKKDGNTLLVEGKASNIVFDGDVNVYTKLTELAKEAANINEKITAETTRATAKEAELSKAIQDEINRATEKETTLESNTTSKLNQFENTLHSEQDRVNVELNKKADKTEMQKQLDSKADVNSPQLKGVPTVETSPDPTDASQRIPSTNWVVGRIAELEKEIKELLAKKADLVNGKLPATQLPDELSLTWIEAQ